jgi:serine/threonine-protein kinase
MRECKECKRCYDDAVRICPEDGQATFHSIGGASLLEGKYQLESRLGQGGMGVVYRARHTYLKTAHAIKVILPDLVGNDPQLVTRFRQEALAAAAIRHHNVVSVTDYGVVEDKFPFLVMEFVQGESLHDLLAREKRLAPEHAVELMSAICAGVAAAHRQKIVHRDLKPLNIMILQNRPIAEAVKILDFGLAKIKSGELLGSFIQAQTTGLMGSPYYMAPEQWADEEPDAQADVYSLGVMLFQMIAGDVPFKGSSIPAIMKKHLYDPPPAFADMGAQVSPQIEAAVRRSLEKDRAKRTPDVETLVSELRDAVGMASQSVIHTTDMSAVLPVSQLQVVTEPPRSSVYLNNTSVGETRDDGSLLLEGIQSGNHLLRVTHDGFEDWQSGVTCDGKPQQVVARLKPRAAGLADETVISQPRIEQPMDTPIHVQIPPTQPTQQIPPGEAVSTQTQMPEFEYATKLSQPIVPVKKGISPLWIALAGVAGLVLLGIFGIAAYLMVFRNSGQFANANSSANRPLTNTVTNTASNSAANTVSASDSSAKMALIAGGKFKMGRNDGRPEERPAHEVEVKSFFMDKTEVTNAEYYEFVKATNHRAPVNWYNGAPVNGKESQPVAFVSLTDTLEFAKWRSKRDGVEYRLPTEAEWEYAARNGAKQTLYPWGNKPDEGMATVGTTEPMTVAHNHSEAGAPGAGQKKGDNDAGVHDLIGNVWEWTSSELAVYPGSNMDIKRGKTKDYIVRGGGFSSQLTGDKAVTATFRQWVETERREVFLGFRLVRNQ